MSSWGDLVKDKKFIQLQSLIRDQEVAIIRGKFGSTHTYSVWDLVVGDIILLGAGDRIPADCLVVESNGLEVEEKNSEDGVVRVRKHTLTNQNQNADVFLFADSIITKGTVKAVVCCVGEKSSRKTTNDLEVDIDTTLQTKLKNLTTYFTKYAFFSSIIIFVLQVMMMIISVSTIQTDGPNGESAAAVFFKKISRLANFAVVLWITSVPEGLPLVTGISLAFSVMKMYADNLLVKKLDAPEKLGLIEEICIGKTGTLTNAQMKVTQFHCDKPTEIIKNSRKNTFFHCELSEQAKLLVQESILFNCEARVEMQNLTYEAVGNPTEATLLRFLQDAEVPVHLHIQKKLGNTLAHQPFNSTLKRSMTVIRSIENPSLVTIYMKGAPEEVLKYCQFQMIGGQQSPVTSGHLNQVLSGVITKMASHPLRCISFAYVQMNIGDWQTIYANQSERPEEILEENLRGGHLELCYLGTFGLKDSLRPRVRSCVEYARDHAKINVRLVSGDNIHTAKQIAIRAGILTNEEVQTKRYAVMDAQQFRNEIGGVTEGQVENEEAFRAISQELRVLARATAQDKHDLVVGLRSLGRKVASTGAFINDVSALDEANCGIAMGSGTAAAKEVSALILTNDDFEAILKAVMWGRNIYHNITRFLQFQITVNVTCLITLFIGIIRFDQEPITAVQLLWINVIMDLFAALALATEPPLKSVIEGPPFSDRRPILTPTVWRQILGVSLWNVIVLVCVMIFAPWAADLSYPRKISSDKVMPSGFNPALPREQQTGDALEYLESQDKKRHLTYMFCIFVFLQVFNMINCRKIGRRDFNVFENFFHNWYFLLMFTLIIVIQIIGTNYFPVIFRTLPLTRSEWGACIMVGSSTLAASALVKLTPEKWVKIDADKFINEDQAD